MREQLKWYDESADNSPWLDALAELRQRATREGHCYQHVQFPGEYRSVPQAAPPARGDILIGAGVAPSIKFAP
jgi:hypothetical protein